MSVVERFSLQERCSRRKTELQEGQKSGIQMNMNFKQNQEDSLRSNLMWRANRLKDKIMEQTNPYDHSINKLTFQTLKQVKRHKQQFQERTKTHPSDQQQQSEHLQRNNQLLKKELLEKLQSCKNKYKKDISIIKKKRQRNYNSNNQLHGGNQMKISISQMLTTAKNRFKTQQQGKKYRNNSEVMHLKKLQKLLPFNFIQKNYPTPTIIRTPTTDKHLMENADANFNADIFQLKNSTNFLSSPSFSQMEIRNSPRHRINITQIINLPFRQIKQQEFSNSKNKRKHYPSAYSNSNNKTDNNKLGSGRSIFVPIGRFLSKQKNIKQQNIVQVSNSPKKYIQNRANKISSDIIEELAQIQFSQNELNAQNKAYLPTHKKLKTESYIKSEHRKKINNSFVSPKKTTNYRYQQLSQKNPIMQFLAQSESKRKLKTQQFPQQKQEVQKEQNQLHCFINIDDLKRVKQSNIDKDKSMMNIESNSGLKSILFNRRITQVSRKVIRNQVNEMNKKAEESPHQKLKGSNSMHLDICGNHLKLHQSSNVQMINKKPQMRGRVDD